MSKQFKNKYKIESIRLQNWDYRWSSAYFITICTKNKKPFFGEIKNGKMELSNIGVIANILWFEIKNHAKNIQLGEFIVMPDHIHGILILNNDNVGGMLHDQTGQTGQTDQTDQTGKETGHALSLQQLQSQQSIGQKRFQNIGKNSVSSIIGSYKSAVTKHARRLGYNFEWQTRFYDSIIHNQSSFDRISNYIINNPKKWDDNNVKKN